jgi:hypothetical protein
MIVANNANSDEEPDFSHEASKGHQGADRSEMNLLRVLGDLGVKPHLELQLA